MEKNLLEIGKIVRAHGVKGAVKVVSYLDDDFKQFKHIYIGEKLFEGNFVKVLNLNNDAYSIQIDTIKTIDEAEKFKNQSIYIDRNEYEYFEDRVYLSDLIGTPVIDENGDKLGELVDFDEYGASVILSIRAGVVTYSLPYVDEYIRYDEEKDAFITTKQIFEDMCVWE